MRTCRHCQKEQPDEQFVTEHGTVCKACRLAQRRAAERARSHREALAREPDPPLIADRVRQALTEHGPLTAREVSELTGVTPLQAATSLTRLQTAGKVVCVGRVSAADSADRRTLIKRWQLCDGAQPTRHVVTVTPFRDPEHEAWLAVVRARQQYRQQQRREWRI